GPTASGKSALAMEIAARLSGVVINADALQVYADWRVLTARPTEADEAAVPHRLYGHVPGDAPYSVGHWLREVEPLLDRRLPVIVGGTGLNFRALTEGLADIPPTPDAVRAEADGMSAEAMLSALDPETAARIDRANPVRVQRAWEVLRATGRGLAAWQDDTGPAAVPLTRAEAFVVNGATDWLNVRIAQRFDVMLREGALEEARANAPTWRPDLGSAKAIGAAELIAHVRGETTLDAAREAVVTQTRQYAKRQRTWFRKRMATWAWMDPSA
ncbi:MAG: tRNA (adenosine(37)-N6)-dimethylallyltransferase MiaA, partial [Pseudomonadota bacterium]